MSSAYTLFYGTFIQLPRQAPPSGQKHALSINHGVLWVSTADGQIKGFDWGINIDNDAELKAWLEKKGWTVVGENDQTTTNGIADGKNTETTVKIVRGRNGRNSFFFPGFIGW
jgi:guanine deaminase